MGGTTGGSKCRMGKALGGGLPKLLLLSDTGAINYIKYVGILFRHLSPIVFKMLLLAAICHSLFTHYLCNLSQHLEVLLKLNNCCAVMALLQLPSADTICQSL